MNRVMRHLLIFLVFISLTSCKTIKETIRIEQLSTELPVVLKYDNKNKTIWSIRIPIKIKLTNSSFKSRKFSRINYLYNPEENWGNSPTIYLVNNSKLSKVNKSNIYNINGYSSKEYILYTQHFIDTIKYSSTYFKDYIYKIKANNNDTLAVKSIKEFKNKHSKLVKYLLENNFINISFIKSYGKEYEQEVGVFGEKGTVKKQYRKVNYEGIKIPVEW